MTSQSELFPTEEQHKLAWEALAGKIYLTKDTIQENPSNTQPKHPGELIIIGSGIQALGFIRGEENLIKQADAVFYCVADPGTVTWIKTLRPDAYDLYVFYGNDKVRYITYMQMTEAMLYYVRQGKRVVAIYYGHPGIFALSPHRAILIAKREGHRAVMKPGVSALDCLCADLGVDPAHPGMQTHEASDLLVRRRELDISLHVVLWQVGLIGEMGFRDQGYINQNFSVLLEYLQGFYGENYPITHYIASRYATMQPVIETYGLIELYNPEIQSKISGISTFYIAPKKSTPVDIKMMERIGLIKPGTLLKTQSQNPLREIGLYGSREMLAFVDLKNFKIPPSYNYQKNTEASRFIIALQEDLGLQELFEKSPCDALDRFPELTKSERNLLITRDASNIQAAAKGLAQRSSANERFLMDLFLNQKLATSLLKTIHAPQTTLISWAQENKYCPDWDLLYKSFSRIARERLLLWTGIYLTEDHKYMITIQGNQAPSNKGTLYVNGEIIPQFSFRLGVLKWSGSFCGFFRLDVNPKGKRRLVGSIWEANSSNSVVFFANELNPNKGPINQHTGIYIQNVKGSINKLKVIPPTSHKKERQLTVVFNEEELKGSVFYQSDPAVLSVGSHKFSLSNQEAFPWTLEKKLAPWFYGTYIIHTGDKQLHKITIKKDTIELDKEVLTITYESQSQLKWAGCSKDYPIGFITFLIDPITLLPCLSGILQDVSEKKIVCYGMIPYKSDDFSPAALEPLFDLPKDIWLTLLEQCKKNSYQGGSFLWLNWCKVHRTTKIIHKLLSKIKN